MKTTIQIIMVVGVAVLYRYFLMDFAIGNSIGLQSNYIFREIVGYGLMFQIVPSVIVKVWSR